MLSDRSPTTSRYFVRLPRRPLSTTARPCPLLSPPPPLSIVTSPSAPPPIREKRKSAANRSTSPRQRAPVPASASPGFASAAHIFARAALAREKSVAAHVVVRQLRVNAMRLAPLILCGILFHQIGCNASYATPDFAAVKELGKSRCNTCDSRCSCCVQSLQKGDGGHG